MFSGFRNTAIAAAVLALVWRRKTRSKRASFRCAAAWLAPRDRIGVAPPDQRADAVAE
jgi:hypothetical protein